MVLSQAVNQSPNTSVTTQMQISSADNEHPTICTLGTLSACQTSKVNKNK